VITEEELMDIRALARQGFTYAEIGRLLATRVHQDLVRDYGFEGSYNTVRRYVERSRPKPERRSEERFETRPGHQAQVD
jgi:transposase